MKELWTRYNALARKAYWYSSAACVAVFIGCVAICYQFVPPAPDWSFLLLHLVSASVASVAYYFVRKHYTRQAQAILDAIDSRREESLQLAE